MLDSGSQITEIPAIQELESTLKALKFGALHCLLILCVGILPVTGFAGVDDLHHPGGSCFDCDIGSIDEPVDCGPGSCAVAATSCGSYHAYSMIVTDPPNPSAAPSGDAGAARGSDVFGPPPPSRIDRPPIT